ncbi:MAG: PAS domain S-box protein, partial [Planctomycetales bacterium]|nr:PAS domain S-box protein [Planctomycetales bacterium]
MSPHDFLSVADLFSEAALLLTREGTVLAANRHFRRWGFEPQSLVGRCLGDVLVNEAVEVSAYLRDCARNREAILGSLTLRKPDGERIACRCDGALLTSAGQSQEKQLLIKFVPQDQSTTQFSALNQKITGLNEEIRRRQLLQNELHAQQESLRITLASIGDGVIVCDAAGQITFLNPIAESLTGWSSADALGRPLERVFRIVSEDDRQVVENPAARVLQEGAIVGLANHTLLISRDGTARPIDDSAAPIRARQGGLEGVVLVFRDVSERRQAELEMGRLAALVDSSDDAILGLTFEGRLTDWNVGAEQLFGFAAEEILGRSIFSSIVPADRQEEMRQALRRVSQGERLEPFETLRLHKDGRIIAVTIRISPILDERGQVIAASAIDRDISQQQAAERRRNARLAVAQVFTRESNSDRAIAEVLSILGTALQWSAGCYWQPTGDGRRLRCREVWQVSSQDLDAFRDASWQLALPPGDGLAGRAWETGQAVWISDLERDGNFHRVAQIRASGLRSALALPVSGGEKFLGVIEWFGQQGGEGDADLMEMMTTVAAQLGQFLERCQSERKLRRSELELKDFFENATVGLHWVGPDGIILRANRAELEMLGYSREEYVGHHIAEFYHEPAVIEQILQRLAAGEELHDCEARLRCKDGSIKHVVINSNVLWEQGRFIHSRCFTRDVTQKMQAEAALQDSEERLRLALQSGRMGSWEWNIVSGRIIWSETLEQIHGLPAGGFDGTFDAYLQDVHPDDRQRVLERIRQTVEEGQDYHVEYRSLRPDGSVRWLETRGKLFRDAAQQPQRLIGVCSDITERKQHEHSLHFLAESSRSLSLLVDFRSTLQKVASLSVPDFADWCTVHMLEEDGSLQRLAVAHSDADKIKLADELERRYPPLPEATHGVMNVLRTGRAELMSDIPSAVLYEAAQDEEHLRLLQSLSLKSYMCVPLHAKERLLGVLTFVRAESGRRYESSDLALAEDLAHRAAVAIENARLYQEVRDADRRKDEFLAMLAHELRNPLAPIRSGLDLLALDEGPHQEIVLLMQEQVEHVVRLVDDLLDVSRIMRGKVELRREVTELSEIMKRAASAVRHNIQSQGQQLRVAGPREPLYLYADPVRILQ